MMRLRHDDGCYLWRIIAEDICPRYSRYRPDDLNASEALFIIPENYLKSCIVSY